MKKTVVISLVLALVISLAACSGLTPRQQRTVTGGAGGAAVGAGLAAITGGSPAVGAAVGGAAGGLGGYFWDDIRGYGGDRR